MGMVLKGSKHSDLPAMGRAIVDAARPSEVEQPITNTQDGQHGQFIATVTVTVTNNRINLYINNKDITHPLFKNLHLFYVSCLPLGEHYTKFLFCTEKPVQRGKQRGSRGSSHSQRDYMTYSFAAEELTGVSFKASGKLFKNGPEWQVVIDNRNKTKPRNSATKTKINQAALPDLSVAGVVQQKENPIDKLRRLIRQLNHTITELPGDVQIEFKIDRLGERPKFAATLTTTIE